MDLWTEPVRVQDFCHVYKAEGRVYKQGGAEVSTPHELTDHSILDTLRSPTVVVIPANAHATLTTRLQTLHRGARPLEGFDADLVERLEPQVSLREMCA